MLFVIETSPSVFMMPPPFPAVVTGDGAPDDGEHASGVVDPATFAGGTVARDHGVRERQRSEVADPTTEGGGGVGHVSVLHRQAGEAHGRAGGDFELTRALRPVHSKLGGACAIDRQVFIDQKFSLSKKDRSRDAERDRGPRVRERDCVAQRALGIRTDRSPLSASEFTTGAVATSVRNGDLGVRSRVGIDASRQPASVVVRTAAAANSESAESSLDMRRYSSRVMPPNRPRRRRRHALRAPSADVTQRKRAS